jgi:hypothetical protein
MIIESRHFIYLRPLMTKTAGDFAAKLHAGDNPGVRWEAAPAMIMILAAVVIAIVAGGFLKRRLGKPGRLPIALIWLVCLLLAFRGLVLLLEKS